MKKVIGIISTIFSFLVLLQACATDFAYSLEHSFESSGPACFLVGMCMFIAGMLCIISKNNKAMTVTALVLYVIAGLTVLTGFKDIAEWSLLCILFAGGLSVDLILNSEHKI